MRTALFAAAGLLLGATTAFPQVPVTLTDFEAHDPGTEVMFRAPGFSGSTSAKLAATPNTAEVTDAFPAGNLNAGSQAYFVSFALLESAADPLWVRLTTFNTATLGNPAISFSQPLQFDIYSDRSIYVTLGLRETDTTAELGAQGGTAGGIEWVGGTTDNTTNPPLGRLVEAGFWTTLTFNIANEPVKGFAGATADGVLESATGKGVLEHLALRAAVDGAEGAGTYNIYLDNFQVVPEPSSIALSLLGSFALLLGFFRKQKL